MSTKPIETEIKIIKGFEKDEIEDFYNQLKDSGYSDEYKEGGSLANETFTELLNGDERFMELKAIIPPGHSIDLEKYLEDNGMPFVKHTGETPEVEQELYVFDGVRGNRVQCNRDGEAYVRMTDLRAVIDLLEKSEEEDAYADLKALVVANESWIETDISKFWRYGMENSIAFSPNYVDPDKDIIDVTVEEDNSEITKSIG